MTATIASCTKLIIYGGLLFFIIHCAQAQTSRINDLKHSIFLSKTDTARINNYISLGIAYSEMNVYDSASWYLSKSISGSESIAYHEGSITARLKMSTVLKNKGEIDSAIQVVKEAVNIAVSNKLVEQKYLTLKILSVLEYGAGHTEEAGNSFREALNTAKQLNDLRHLSDAYNNMGIFHSNHTSLDSGVICYLQSLEIEKELNNDYGAAISCNNIGHIYSKNNNAGETALEYFFQALSFLEKIEANHYMLASVYSGIGGVYGQWKEYEKVLEYGKKSLTHARLTEHRPNEVYGLQLMGMYYKLSHPDSALYYLFQARDILKHANDERELAKTHRMIGETGLAAKKVKLAVQYYEEALAYAQKTEWKILKADCLKGLMDAYYLSGNYQLSSEFAIQYRDLYDSLYAKEKLEIINELNEKYKTKEKEAQLQLQAAQLQRQQVFNIGFSIFALLLGSFAFFIYKSLQHRKQANALLTAQAKKLKSLDTAKSRFFANISHELRTPLTLIIAPLEDIIQYTQNNLLKDKLEIAHSNAKKLLTLVNEILDLSKLESGQLKLNESEVYLQEVLRRILFSYHSLANIKGFILSFEYHLPQHLYIKLDVSKFEKVINNLISNAFKYSFPGGVITLKANELRTGWICIEIQDQGKGIAPDVTDKIFDRFYQAETKDDPLQGGSGIGLALAKELAHALGGNLTVESEPGKGSNFMVTLPIREITHRPKPKTVPAIEIKKSENGISQEQYHPILLNENKAKILIVEDNPEMSQFLVDILAPHYQSMTALDGLQALEMIQTNSFDLIISDVMMPNMDGFSLLKELRSDQQRELLPVVLLTARSLEEDKLKGLQLGVDDYITKPFSSRELIARIQNLLKNRSRREAWLQSELKNNSNSSLAGETESADRQFIRNAEKLVTKNIANPGYGVEQLASDMAYSRRQLGRILRKLTGMMPVEFIREIRLQHAFRMLENRNYKTVAEVRTQVGFENASYFTKVFQKRFGKKPSEFLI